MEAETNMVLFMTSYQAPAQSPLQRRNSVTMHGALADFRTKKAKLLRLLSQRT